jgi:hypothetical protein
MRFVFVAAAVGAFVGAAISWNVATVAALRILSFDLSFSIPFQFYRRKVPEVLNALEGRTINTYVVVSGLLLFACPLFAGLSAYDYVVRRYVQHSTYGLKGILAAVASLVVLVILGVWVSIGYWQKGTESGIGIAMLAILLLKVSTDLTGPLTAVFLVVTAVCCSFVYFGVRRITGTLSGKQYPIRRDTEVQRNFVSEKFVPTESPTAEKVAMVQKLMASGVNVDLPSNELGDEEQK